MEEARAILLVDGVCALCSGFVKTVAACDTKHRVWFEAQQSDVGQSLLRKYNLPNDLSTVVLLDYGGGGKHPDCYTRSSAAIRTLAMCSAPWCAAVVFLAIPKPLRDLAYDGVAKARYYMFGKTEACGLPDAALRKRVKGQVAPRGALDGLEA